MTFEARPGLFFRSSNGLKADALAMLRPGAHSGGVVHVTIILVDLMAALVTAAFWSAGAAIAVGAGLLCAGIGCTAAWRRWRGKRGA